MAHRSRRGIHIPDLISTERCLTQKEGESFEAFASVTRTADDRDAEDHHIL